VPGELLVVGGGLPVALAADALGLPPGEGEDLLAGGAGPLADGGRAGLPLEVYSRAFCFRSSFMVSMTVSVTLVLRPSLLTPTMTTPMPYSFRRSSETTRVNSCSTWRVSSGGSVLTRSTGRGSDGLRLGAAERALDAVLRRLLVRMELRNRLASSIRQAQKTETITLFLSLVEVSSSVSSRRCVRAS